MALSCPQCSNSIEADFGVVTCPKCQAVLFVDMDGNVQLSQSTGDFFPQSSPQDSISTSVEPVEAFSSGSSWGQDQNPAMESENFNPSFEVAAEEIPRQETAAVEVEMENLEEALENDSASVYEPEEEMTLNQEISEVSDYSNSETSHGPLSYSILIQGIDTKDIRQSISEALEDPKFQWDPREILKTVKAGQLKLENLNPVKASVLIHRLQDLPVKVSWVQNVYA